MPISHEEVLRIARLARLDVRPEDATALLERLNRVLALVEEMRRADTSGVEPMAHPLDAVQRLRADAVTEADQRELYQSVAPSAQEGLYLVPKVLE